MKLAVNYSPQAADLLREGVIGFDVWKCSPWPELVSASRRTRLPLYLHFDLQAGTGEVEDYDLDEVAAQRAETGTPYVNLHVTAQRSDYLHIPVESRERAHADEVLERTARDVRAVADRFGAGHVILENLPYRGPDANRLRVTHEGEFLRHLCDATGCGFLLDVAHARTAAHHLGLDGHEYLSSLPVHRLRELHVTGVDRDEQGRLREHMPLGEEDWELLEWCLDRVREGAWAHPWALAFEYGGIGPVFEWRSEAGVLAEQVPRLADLVASLPRSG